MENLGATEFDTGTPRQPGGCPYNPKLGASYGR